MPLAIIAGIFIIFASLLPLSSYIVSLSLFGLAHIFYELSYIRKNISAKLPKTFLIAVIALLTVLLIIKIYALCFVFNYSLQADMVILSLLMLITLYFKNTLINTLIVILFATALVLNPFFLLMALAFLHNLTPWGFLAAQQKARKAWIIFAINPLLVFSIAWFINVDANNLTNPLTLSYVAHYWSALQITPLAMAFFSTAVYLQLIHYYYVIRVLPKFCKTPVKVNATLIVLFLLLGLGLLINYNISKPIYAVVAMFHAYLEIPLLLYLLPARPLQPIPTRESVVQP